ncbi:MAG: metal-dependent hydrolase [Actinomycetota bacterium]|nr:metal-dependent hydrolase [Actinomycetota bacterium]
MILWHAGLAALVVYVTLGRRRIDYRFVLIGAVLPDLVDALVAAFTDDNGSGRGAAHSLLTVVAVAPVVVLAFKGTTRLAVFGIPVGWLLHLVGDGMWNAPRTFLWPAFGTAFSKGPAEPYSWDLLSDPGAHLTTWGAEVAGALVLAWFWVAFGLGHEGRARLFLRDGYLRPWEGRGDRVAPDNP